MLCLYNTLTRKKQEFKPLEDKQARVYTCGPTVYDFAHIGNLRAYVFADVLRRALEANDFEVKHVINITDVGHLTGDRDMGEDKVEKKARKEQKSAWEIASYYTDAFLSDIRELNIKTADKYPKATDHIQDMIELIQALEERGCTYQTSDGIYFDTSKLSDYGKLARLDLEGLQEGARVEKNPEKKNPADFALWKFSTPSPSPPYQGGDKRGGRQMEWKSPWGVGFPGWHIECSAMSRKYLGQPFDIHTGGVDHVPVHHTNEIAQSESAYGKPLANFWMHAEFLVIDKARIGKSEDNIITLEDLKNRGYSPAAYRYFALQGHYRSILNFSWKALDSAKNSLNNLYAAIGQIKKAGKGVKRAEQDFLNKINDDLNTPEALSVMWEMMRSDEKPEDKLKTLFEMDKILGLALRAVWEELRKPLPDNVKQLVERREELRKQKNWNEADQVREGIKKLGYQVNDTDEGPVVLPLKS